MWAKGTGKYIWGWVLEVINRLVIQYITIRGMLNKIENKKTREIGGGWKFINVFRVRKYPDPSPFIPQDSVWRYWLQTLDYGHIVENNWPLFNTIICRGIFWEKQNMSKSIQSRIVSFLTKRKERLRLKSLFTRRWILEFIMFILGVDWDRILLCSANRL